MQMTNTNASGKNKFTFFTVHDILRLPPTEWLIDGMVEKGTQAVLYGPSGDGKSFVGLDWALSVATGSPWQGRAVTKGRVVYVVAEGGKGIGKRILDARAPSAGHQPSVLCAGSCSAEKSG